MIADWISMGITIFASIVGSSVLTAYVNNKHNDRKDKEKNEKQLLFSYLHFLTLLQEYIGECMSYKINNFVLFKDGEFNFRCIDTYHCCPPEPSNLIKLVNKDAPPELIHLVLELDRLHKQSKLELQHINDPDYVRFESDQEACDYFEKLFYYAAYLALEAVKEIQNKYHLKNYLIGVDETKLKALHDEFVKESLP